MAQMAPTTALERTRLRARLRPASRHDCDHRPPHRSSRATNQGASMHTPARVARAPPMATSAHSDEPP